LGRTRVKTTENLEEKKKAKLANFFLNLAIIGAISSMENPSNYWKI
jgi:hypothetical protein